MRTVSEPRPRRKYLGVKRFSQKARVWVKFADGTSESFSVPLSLVSRLAPVVRAAYPGWTHVWVEHGPTVVMLPRGDDCGASDLRTELGGGYVAGGCPVCGAPKAESVGASCQH